MPIRQDLTDTCLAGQDRFKKSLDYLSSIFSWIGPTGFAQSLEESLNVKVDLIVNGTLKDYITPKVNNEKFNFYNYLEF